MGTLLNIPRDPGDRVGGGGVLPCVCVGWGGASRWLSGIQGRSIQHLSLGKLLQEQPAGDCRRNPSPGGKTRSSVPSPGESIGQTAG